MPDHFALHIDLATTLWRRLVGLLGRPVLAGGQGLWLSPCNAIHTFGLTYAIDVVFFDNQLHPIKFVSHLPPRRFSVCWRAKSVLELPAGTLAQRHCGKGLE